jgi:hypothetical protein
MGFVFLSSVREVEWRRGDIIVTHEGILSPAIITALPAPVMKVSFEMVAEGPTSSRPLCGSSTFAPPRFPSNGKSVE